MTINYAKSYEHTAHILHLSHQLHYHYWVSQVNASISFNINIIMTIGFIFCFILSSLRNPTIQYSHFNLPTSLSFSGLRTETMTRWIGEIVHLRMLGIRGLTFPSSLNPALNGKSCNNIKKQSSNLISGFGNAYKMHSGLVQDCPRDNTKREVFRRLYH